jgi:hypothetical protein
MAAFVRSEKRTFVWAEDTALGDAGFDDENLSPHVADAYDHGDAVSGYGT